MTRAEKIKRLEHLCQAPFMNEDPFYLFLEESGDLKINYTQYATSLPLDCDKELQRIPDADYDTCCALLTMLLREDHFSNGSFHHRHQSGQITPLLQKMLHLLKANP